MVSTLISTSYVTFVNCIQETFINSECFWPKAFPSAKFLLIFRAVCPSEALVPSYQITWYHSEVNRMLVFTAMKSVSHLLEFNNILQYLCFMWFLVCWWERKSSETVFSASKKFSTMCHILWWTGCTLSKEIRFWRGKVIFSKVQVFPHLHRFDLHEFDINANSYDYVF
jgi:hypothetical protein